MQGIICHTLYRRERRLLATVISAKSGKLKKMLPMCFQCVSNVLKEKMTG